MKPRRYHGLKRPKLRQSWNKYNLYNIWRQQRLPDVSGRKAENMTFFQKKWRAKGMLRAYHGEHVVERKWVRMFSRRLLGVTEMETKYMAAYDGSEKAAGRGTGKDVPPNWNKDFIAKRIMTPYMQMTFAPMERRLDIAVFRAMFASSTRQARQFCVHGAVKVNGKVMPHPAYRLNPGDMFQVNPDFVMYATGVPKLDPNKRKISKKSKGFKREASAGDAETTGGREEAVAAASAEDSDVKAADVIQDPDTTDAPEPVKEDMKPTQKQIQDLIKQAKEIIDDDQSAGAKRRQMLRYFIRKARSLLSRAGRPSASPTQVLDELTKMVSEVDLARDNTKSSATESSQGLISDLSKDEFEELEHRIALHAREEEENPYDPSKPYKTPWQPRHYMSPFAFIPKYLEVNQNICAAVYLRHPVARLGRAEVPTPYNYDVSQLAYTWYLRRR